MPFVRFVQSHKWESLVDFGCGFGLHCGELAKGGRKITGVDLGFLSDALDAAKAGGYELVGGSWDNLPSESFDVGYSFHCLEHSRDPIGWLHAWGRAIKPGGKLFVAVPGHSTRVAIGHIAMGWSPGQLMYLTALAGWDCRDGRFWSSRGDVYGVADRPAKMVLGDVTDGRWGDNPARMPCPSGSSFDGLAGLNRPVGFEES